MCRAAVVFAASFAVAVPVMLMMFRDNGAQTRDSLVKSLVFAASIALIVAISLGRGRP